MKMLARAGAFGAILLGDAVLLGGQGGDPVGILAIVWHGVLLCA
jgi:hypothetical protein